MWKLLEISNKTHFIYCDLNTNDQKFTFILYDLKDTWCETITINDVKQKVMSLNKRFDFSEDNIKEAFTSDSIQFAAIEEQPHTSAIDGDNCLLKLKHRVKNCPLTYEWKLKRQNLIEFQQTFLKPLLMALLGCYQQVEILKDCVRRKDLELQQYRLEGAVLERTTLATKPFDFNDFHKKYEQCNKVTINFKKLAKYIQENDTSNLPTTINENLKINNNEQDVEPNEKQNSPQNTKTKLSARERKRKAQEFRAQLLEQQLKLRKRGFVYESSESQSLSGNSQSIEEAEINDAKLQQSTKESKSEKTLTPRKSARCSPMKQKREYMSSEGKTDSENENNSKTARERKATKGVVNATNDKGKKSEHNHNNSPGATNTTTTTKCVKSLNLSYNCPTKCLDKPLENSNIFDFSTDTEDDKPLRQSRKLAATKTSKSSMANSCERLHSASTVMEKVTIEKVASNLASSGKKNLSHSPTPHIIIDDLSSQLSNIKKELECLEAMRLADLKQRTCKA